MENSRNILVSTFPSTAGEGPGVRCLVPAGEQPGVRCFISAGICLVMSFANAMPAAKTSGLKYNNLEKKRN